MGDGSVTRKSGHSKDSQKVATPGNGVHGNPGESQGSSQAIYPAWFGTPPSTEGERYPRTQNREPDIRPIGYEESSRVEESCTDRQERQYPHSLEPHRNHCGDTSDCPWLAHQFSESWSRLAKSDNHGGKSPGRQERDQCRETMLDLDEKPHPRRDPTCWIIRTLGRHGGHNEIHARCPDEGESRCRCRNQDHRI